MKPLEFLRAATIVLFIDDNNNKRKGIIETVKIKDEQIEYEIDGKFYSSNKVLING
jgi:hypothetical protein